jgi:bacteriorhodopsin
MKKLKKIGAILMAVVLAAGALGMFYAAFANFMDLPYMVICFLTACALLWLAYYVVWE